MESMARRERERESLSPFLCLIRRRKLRGSPPRSGFIGNGIWKITGGLVGTVGLFLWGQLVSSPNLPPRGFIRLTMQSRNGKIEFLSHSLFFSLLFFFWFYFSYSVRGVDMQTTARINRIGYRLEDFEIEMGRSSFDRVKSGRGI